MVLFDVLLLDLGSGRHRPTSETTNTFYVYKNEPAGERRIGGGGKIKKEEKTKQIKLVRSGLNGDTMPDVRGNFFTIANGLEHEPAANQDGTTHLYADIDLRWQQLPASLPRRRP